MLNVNELEIRHKKYKLKSYIPYFVLTAITAVFGFVVAFVLYNSDSNIEAINEDQIQKEPVAIAQKEINSTIEDNNLTAKETIPEPIAVENTVIAENQEKVILAPSLDFIRKIESDSPIHYENRGRDNLNSTNTETKKIKEIPVAIKEEKKEEPLPVVVEKIEEKMQKVDSKGSVNIKIKNDENEIEEVIKRFKVNNNPALSLFIAKKYYQLGDYNKAYNYALTTNEINNNIEESWIIFSKSLVKLNKKDMAVQTLKKYIEHSGSSQAKQLLDEILSGKFR